MRYYFSTNLFESCTLVNVEYYDALHLMNHAK